MENIDDIIKRIFRESIQIKETFLRDNLERVARVVEVITDALKKGNKILLFGNGGSAADAQHIAGEFVNRFLIERPPLPAIALTTDTSVLTSIGNDYDFAEVFSKQIRALGQEGDIAWGFSTSGGSVNVIRAFEAAKKMGLVTIGFTGRDGGTVGMISDYHLNVPSNVTPRVQEVHIVVSHAICELVDWRLFQRPDHR
jgi:D-sedoheptulose 7-phosphate isomerase